ncbi:MAG: recombination protein RecR [Candidatus Schekmanbacteria bacterium]|nr:MAG: recombination protein RecR [Candidatus Schekmanbacteria bacterium]
MKYASPTLEKLIQALTKLPGIGRKTANRLAAHILKMEKSEAENLADAIKELKENIRFCKECFNITEEDICIICKCEERTRKVICVVENYTDLIAIEQTGKYKGLYHVLGGAISPLDGIGPEDLKIEELVERVKRIMPEEVVIATNLSSEGEATSMYIAKILKPLGIKLSRIAYGLPVGGDLEYADDITISRALEGRRIL